MTKKFPKEFNYYDKYCVTCGHDTCGGIQEQFYLKEEVDECKEDLRKLCDKVCYHVDKDDCDCFEKLKEEILKRLE